MGTLESEAPASWRSLQTGRGLICGFGARGDSGPPGSIQVRQVHGARVVDAGGLDPERCSTVEADALVCSRPGVIAAVRTADCVPILMVAGHRDWAAAVHAGWRGTIGGIAGAAVARAAEDAVESGDLFVALGPSIGPCCYEVDDDLAERFSRSGLPVARGSSARSGPHLDLREINRSLLVAAGVRSDRIEFVGPCTRCESDRYHSYRAAPSDPGRQLSWIGWQS